MLTVVVPLVLSVPDPARVLVSVTSIAPRTVTLPVPPSAPPPNLRFVSAVTLGPLRFNVPPDKFSTDALRLPVRVVVPPETLSVPAPDVTAPEIKVPIFRFPSANDRVFASVTLPVEPWFSARLSANPVDVIG